MEAHIESIIIRLLQELNEEVEHIKLETPNANTRLFGTDGVLDSLTLVSFLADLEEEIDEVFGRSLVLADERAMSQTTSPFRSVENLTHYIVGLMSE